MLVVCFSVCFVWVVNVIWQAFRLRDWAKITSLSPPFLLLLLLTFIINDGHGAVPVAMPMMIDRPTAKHTRGSLKADAQTNAPNARETGGSLLGWCFGHSFGFCFALCVGFVSLSLGSAEPLPKSRENAGEGAIYIQTRCVVRNSRARKQKPSRVLVHLSYDSPGLGFRLSWCFFFILWVWEAEFFLFCGWTCLLWTRCRRLGE